MSDHEAPDPMDKAYVEAETLLDDEAARDARRAKLLAAVAEDRTQPAAAAATPRFGWRPDWRRDRWLAAACVAGFALFLGLRLYHPLAPPQPLQQQAGPATGRLAKPTFVAPSAAPAKPAAQPVASKKAPAFAEAPPPPVLEAQPRAVPPAPVVAMAPRAFPASPAEKEVTVTGGRAVVAEDKAAPLALAPRREGRAEAAPAPAPPPPPPPPPPSSAFLGGWRDEGARLSAAAAAGRTDEVESLLAEGVPVDTADPEGDTALMRSVLADRPQTAAILVRHGASLDRRNHAGATARDMALKVADPKLDEALGISR